MISGKRVTLRRVEPADHPLIQRWQNDPDVFRMMDYERPFTLEDIQRSEAKAIDEGHPFIIEFEDQPVGRIGLNSFRNRDQMASLYVFVGERSVWGQGVGLDAIMALLAYAFDVLNLRKIELWTLADNDRAMKMYKHAGFVEDGRLPERSWKGDRYLDHVVMSVDRDDFARARASYGL